MCDCSYFIIVLKKKQGLIRGENWYNEGNGAGGIMIKLNFESKVDTEKASAVLKEIAKDKMGGWFNLPRK